MELLLLSVPSILAGVFAAVALVLICRSLMTLERLFHNGRSLVSGAFMAGNILGPVGFHIWLQSLEVDGPEGLAIFMLWVFVWATAAFGLAFFAGSMMESRPHQSRQLFRSWF